MKITKAMVIIGRGADCILLTTDLPCATWPYNGEQLLRSEAAAGTGVNYVRAHFEIEPEVINLESSNHKN